MFNLDHKHRKMDFAPSDGSIDTMINQTKSEIQKNFSKYYKINDLFLLESIIPYFKISIDLLKLELTKQQAPLKEMPIIWPWLKNKKQLNQQKAKYKAKINDFQAKIRQRQEELALLRFAQQQLSYGCKTFDEIIAFVDNKGKQLEKKYNKGGRTVSEQNKIMVERNFLIRKHNKLVHAHDVFVNFHKKPSAYLTSF